MALSNAICIIVTMVSTYWATHSLQPQSSNMMMKGTPLSHLMATNINLSIDVKMSIEEEKHKVHNLLFSVPTHVLYDAVLTVLTPMQAVKLQHDIRRATDSMTQKIFDFNADEPSNEPPILKEEEKDTLSTALYRSRSMTENKASDEISKRFKKESLVVSKTRGESLTTSLHTSLSPSTIPDDQILMKLGTSETKQFSASHKKRYFKHGHHFITSPSSAMYTKSKTLISTFEDPLQSRRLSLPELKTMSEPTHSQTGLCQVLGIEIKTDLYGSGTTWMLKNDETDEVILSGGPYEDNKVVVNNYESCLNPGLYKFIIYYSNDDDMWDSVYYMLTLNGAVLHIGRQRGSRDIIPIRVILPSYEPSVSLKPAAMPPVTFHPTIQHSTNLKTSTTSLPTQYCTGEGEVQGQVRISATDKPVTLVWDVYKSQSDVVLFEGGLGSRDICVTEHGCYTFRIRDGVQEVPFNLTLTLEGVIQLQEDALDTKYAGRFGFRSCCKTTCCPTNQATMEMVIHTDGPTEDLKWNLFLSKEESMNNETLVINGGQYDGNDAYYITEICIDPTICHTLEILGENETLSYKSIVIKVNSETKLREYNVQAGSSVKFCSVCSTEPLLVESFESSHISDEDGKRAFGARLGAIMQILGHISSQEELLNTNTAQYKAACWIIHDDLLQVQASDPTLVQRYALVVLYYATGGEHWSLPGYELNYLSNDNECNWNIFYEDYDKAIGIECTEDGKIKYINLSGMNLKGELPSEISSLRNLEELYLDHSSLEGSIPVELGKLKVLKRLHVWDNSLTGSIPENIFDLSELQYLDLGTNSLTGTLSTLVGKLYKLEKLWLESQSLTGSIPDELFGIRNLTTFYIRDNAINSTIPSSIHQASKLEYLDLTNNTLSGTIPPTIARLQNLQSLLFDGNQLQGSIPEAITLLKNLTLLSFENNLLQGTIPQNIGSMENLRDLLLSNNNLHGTIPSSLSKLPDLAELQLQGNNLEGTMPKEICDLRDVNLTLLAADCAYEYAAPKVECECCTYCIGRFTNLEHEGICHDSELRIEMSYESDNWYSKYWSVTNEANQAILSENYGYVSKVPTKSSYRACISSTDCFMFLIDGYRSYESEWYPFLNFSIYVNETKIYDNSDTENQIWYGRIDFGYSGALRTSVLDQCDNVQYYDKSHASGSKERLILNEISGISGYSIILDEVRAEYKAAKWIVYGDKHNYDISDKFRIVQRYVLAVLYYSTNGEGWINNTNYITDNNECEWAGVTCDDNNVVEGLDLHQNNIIGTIPHETGKLSMLKHFDISDNKGLSGTLPTEIQNLWSIETMDVSNCTISGSIPDKIWLWDSFYSLNLCCNEITGSLPNETSNARKIEFLDLHDNLISGNLPRFSDETKLRELDLSNNYFEGNLNVGSRMKLDYLGKLSLGRNLLTGTIPSDISAAIGLKVLDLSSNGFTGYIPSGLNNMKELKILMLNGNKLRGTIPPELFNIRGLNKVMLQSNELTGTISSQIGGLKELEQISLSYNALKGTLPEEIKDIKTNLTILHVHFNKLVGKTSWMDDCNEWSDERNFVADCGRPTASNDPIGCKCCTICCNSDGYCRSNEVSEFTPIQGVLISCAVIFVFLMICAVITKYMKKYNMLPIYKLNLVKAINDESIYCFLLTNDKICLCFAFLIILCQFFMFVSFLIAASYKTEGFLVAPEFQSEVDDTIYSKRCYPDSLECTDEKYITLYGWALFTLLMLFFMSRDLVISIKLLYTAAMSRSYRLFFGGATILIMTTVAISASVFYNKAIAETDSQLVLNALLLTVFSQIDEEAMSLLRAICRSWVERKLNEATRYSRGVMSKHAILEVNQQEVMDHFETDQNEDEEAVPRNDKCCIFNLFVDMFHTYVGN